jgi:hypothetical protein
MASFEYFRPDFQLFSLSLCWRDDQGKTHHWFDTRPSRIEAKIMELTESQDQIVCHNIGFEIGCIEKCYPKSNLNWYCDTMRLGQLRDGGGDEFAVPTFTLDQQIAIELGELSAKDLKSEFSKKKGLGLEACAARFLDNVNHNHKNNAHTYLEEKHGITKNHGGNLHLLPYTLLEEYNNADTLVTLLLYENITEYFKTKEPFDWTRDNELYLTRAKLMSKAYCQGIKINQEKLLDYILKIEAEVAEIDNTFATRYAKEILQVRKMRYKIFRDKFADLKTDKGREKRWIKTMEGRYRDEYSFNINSAKQMEMLCVGALGMTAELHTPGGAPSFKASHLSQWGDLGKLLFKRKKRLLVLNQCVNTYVGSLTTGRMHCSIRVSGTRTNRVAGGRD